jgi:antirestriction protein ArdC
VQASEKLPWSGYSIKQSAINFTNDKYYSGGNQFFLQLVASVKGHKTPFWAGYQQWASLGCNVKQGEKGTKVFRPRIFKDKGTDEAKLCGMHVETVFNADQVEGLDLSSFKGFTSSTIEPKEQADKIINEMPQRPSIGHTNSNLAYYSPLTDSVTMPSAVSCSSEEYYSILFHELAHSTGHESRLNRASLTKIQGHNRHEYSKEELVAEMTAAILCNESGIANKDTVKNSAAYIQSWFKVLKNDPKMLYEASGAAYKAAKFILKVKE